MVPGMTEEEVREWLDAEVKYLTEQVKALLGDSDSRRAKRLLGEAMGSASAEGRKEA